MQRELFGYVIATLLFGACVSLVVFAFSAFANAHDGEVHESLSETLIEKRERYEDSRESIGERRVEASSTVPLATDDFKKKMAERRSALSGRIKERVHNLFANVIMRLDALVRRFEQIDARLESRVAKNKASGANTTSAESALSDARLSLGEAKASLKILSAMDLNIIVDAESPSEKFLSLRIAIVGVRENLMKTQSSLTRTVTELKNSESLAPASSETAAETAATSTLIDSIEN